MRHTNIHELKVRLAHDARLAKAGETDAISQRNKPFAELRPVADSPKIIPKRRVGMMNGWFPVPDDINTPDLELEDIIENGSVFPPAVPPAPCPVRP